MRRLLPLARIPGVATHYYVVPLGGTVRTVFDGEIELADKDWSETLITVDSTSVSCVRLGSKPAGDIRAVVES